MYVCVKKSWAGNLVLCICWASTLPTELRPQAQTLNCHLALLSIIELIPHSPVDVATSCVSTVVEDGHVVLVLPLSKETVQIVLGFIPGPLSHIRACLPSM